jgi:hypothetical protein
VPRGDPPGPAGARVGHLRRLMGPAAGAGPGGGPRGGPGGAPVGPGGPRGGSGGPRPGGYPPGGPLVAALPTDNTALLEPPPRGAPRGGPPGPASGPRPPIGGAPPRGDEGTVCYLKSKKQKKNTKESHGAIDRKRGVKTPTQAYNWALFGPPCRERTQCAFGGAPRPPYRPLLNWT